MSGIQIGNFVSAFGLKYKTLIDVGGSAELLSLMVAKHSFFMIYHMGFAARYTPITNATIQQFQLGRQSKISKEFL
jgi:hypothetical protein